MKADYSADSHNESNPQESSLLTKLPIELLYMIVDNLDVPSILALRMTCCLASDLVLPSFRKLLKSRKYFLHPYSFNLLEELSTSRFAECVERIVIGTETFEPTFHLTSAEYGRTLSTTFQRFTHLRAVEIRDFVAPSSDGHVACEFDEQWLTMYRGLTFDRQLLPGHRLGRFFCRHSCHKRYNARWGDEADDLHSQGFGHVLRQHGYRAFRRPTRVVVGTLADNLVNPSELLGGLFSATLQACSVAKTAGVNITDFRVALLYNWGVQDTDMPVFNIGHEQEQFLSSLEVLHLAIFRESLVDGTISNRIVNIRSVLSACKSLKWLRVDVRSPPNNPDTSEWDDLCNTFSEIGHRLQLERLDLGNVGILKSKLTSLILNCKPKILNIAGGTLWVPPLPEEENADERMILKWGWEGVLHDIAGVVENVRVVHIQTVRLDPRRWRVLASQHRVQHVYVSLSLW